jgi:hypothetical protein
MKYFVAIFTTAVIIFLAATIYYKGLPNFTTPSGVSVVSNEEVVATPEPTATPVSEDIAAIIKTALIKKYGTQASDMKVTVSTVSGEYAKGMVTEQGGGGMWFAARQNGFWTLVWDGNGQIDCTDISPFPEFPANLIPECWNSTTNKFITR